MYTTLNNIYQLPRDVEVTESKFVFHKEHAKLVESILLR